MVNNNNSATQTNTKKVKESIRMEMIFRSFATLIHKTVNFVLFLNL